jgi:hypothetical protein
MNCGNCELLELIDRGASEPNGCGLTRRVLKGHVFFASSWDAIHQFLSHVSDMLDERVEDCWDRSADTGEYGVVWMSVSVGEQAKNMCV